MDISAGGDPVPLTVLDLDRSERCRGTVVKLAVRVLRRPGTVALGAVVAAAVLTSCGNRYDGDSATAPTIAPSPALDSVSPPTLDGERTVIKTRIVGFAGQVLPGSTLGSAVFCRGGTVRHDRGNLEIGFPAVNVFSCPAGSLSIGFGPGPGQMDQAVQTSDWRVLGGAGSFAGATGEGTMRVRFEHAGAAIGHETFTGVVVLP